MRFHHARGSQDMQSYQKGSDGQSDSTVLWAKVHHSPGGMCPSEGLASRDSCPKCTPWGKTAGMEFSQSLQDSVKSAYYQLKTPTNSGGGLLYSTFFPTLDIVIRFQFESFL